MNKENAQGNIFLGIYWGWLQQVLQDCTNKIELVKTSGEEVP